MQDGCEKHLIMRIGKLRIYRIGMDWNFKSARAVFEVDGRSTLFLACWRFGLFVCLDPTDHHAAYGDRRPYHRRSKHC